MLVRAFRLFGGSVCLLAAAAATVGGQTIDQEQTTQGNIYVGSTGTGQGEGWFFQEFTPSQATSAGAGFLLGNQASPTGSLTIQLWSVPPSSTSATMLAHGTGAVLQVYNYYDVFWQAVAVTPGQQYTLAFFSPQRSNPVATNFPGNTNGGTGGHIHYNDSQTITDPYQDNSCCTTAFREYSTGSMTTTTPEPSSMALLGTGLIGLVPVIRKRWKGR